MGIRKSSALPARNRALIGESIAILLCPGPGPNNCTIGVTIDREDLERVQAFGFWRVGLFPGGLYCYFAKAGGNIYLHRFILNAREGQVVDHEKHRTLDNRKSEIRECTQGLNQLNRIYGGHGRSGIRGVYRTKNKSGTWWTRIRLDNKEHYLGTFPTKELAAERVRQFLIERGAAYVAGVPACQ